VGYEGVRIYCLYNPVTKKVSCYSDVIFDKTESSLYSNSMDYKYAASNAY
jgi:hypothetical protein